MDLVISFHCHATVQRSTKVQLTSAHSGQNRSLSEAHHIAFAYRTGRETGPNKARKMAQDKRAKNSGSCIAGLLTHALESATKTSSIDGSASPIRPSETNKDGWRTGEVPPEKHGGKEGVKKLHKQAGEGERDTHKGLKKKNGDLQWMGSLGRTSTMGLCTKLKRRNKASVTCTAGCIGVEAEEWQERGPKLRGKNRKEKRKSQRKGRERI